MQELRPVKHEARSHVPAKPFAGDAALDRCVSFELLSSALLERRPSHKCSCDDYHASVQLEGIALDPEAENGIASIGSVDANNLGFSQTQATQASQVCTVIGCIGSLPKTALRTRAAESVPTDTLSQEQCTELTCSIP